MRDVLSLAVFLYSIIKNGLISSVIGPVFPVFAIKNSFGRFFCNILQALTTVSEKLENGKNFPLKTVMGPHGPITRC